MEGFVIKKKYIVLIILGCVLYFLVCGALIATPFVLALSEESSQCDVEILEYYLDNDYSGNDLIVVAFRYTNNTGYTTNLNDECEITAYQEGVELRKGYPDNNATIDSQDLTRNLKNGATYTYFVAFQMIDIDKDVEINVDDYSTLKDIDAEKTFKLSEAW